MIKPDNAKDQSGGGLSVIASGHTRADNIGGLDGTMHRVAFTLPAWEGIDLRSRTGGVLGQSAGSSIKVTSAGKVMPSFSSTPLFKASIDACVGVPST